MYFEGNPPANQFLCRAYLCQGQLKSPPATESVVRTVNWTHTLKGVVCVCVFLRPRDIYTCNYCSGILYSFALKTCSSFANKLQRFYHASSVSNKYWPLLHLSAAYFFFLLNCLSLFLCFYVLTGSHVPFLHHFLF